MARNKVFVLSDDHLSKLGCEQADIDKVLAALIDKKAVPADSKLIEYRVCTGRKIKATIELQSEEFKDVKIIGYYGPKL